MIIRCERCGFRMHQYVRELCKKCYLKTYYEKRAGKTKDQPRIKRKGKKTQIMKEGVVKEFDSAADASRYLELNTRTVATAISNKMTAAGWTPSYI